MSQGFETFCNGHPRVGTFSKKGLPDHLQPHQTLPWPGTALETQAFLNLASATISTATRRTTSLGSQLKLWPVVPPTKASVESPYSSAFECCYLVSGQAGHTCMDSNSQYIYIYMYIYIYITYMYTVYRPPPPGFKMQVNSVFPSDFDSSSRWVSVLTAISSLEFPPVPPARLTLGSDRSYAVASSASTKRRQS